MGDHTRTSASILIVDDNLSLVKTMSFVLKRKGYAVATAADGPEAIDKVRNAPFDVIFMDVQMPVLNGVETYREIKAVRPGSIVVMMTAYAVEDLVQEALAEGAYDILYKPIDFEKVVALIEQAQTEHAGALILVVDDDHGTCETLKSVLVKSHYNVGIAHAGEEAVAMAEHDSYDVLLIDMKLPTINGLKTYLAIKKVNPEAIAVVMTAYREEMAELIDKAMDNAAYACIYKPLDMGRVLRLIEEITKRKRGAT